MSSLLQGIRILSVEQYGAGPYGTMLLADLGAEVIKIEDAARGGDVSRSVRPYPIGDGDSQFFQTFSKGKKSVSLDLKSAEGRGAFHKLVAESDVVSNNLRGDQPEKLGLTFESLKSVNPRIVCAHLSAYGREGSRANWPGFDYLMQAETGYFALTGEPDSPPTRMGLSIVDLMTGLGLAYSVAIGVLSARETGMGRDMDISLFDTALFNLCYPGTWYLNAGVNQQREPRSGHPSLVPCALYTTKDGWIYIMCNKEKFWPALCDAIDRPEWADDPRFATFAERLGNRMLLQDLLDAELSHKSTAEWLEIFAGSVPAAPLNDVKSALDNPFVAERGLIQTLDLKGHGDIRLIDTPIKSGVSTPSKPAPTLGEQTDELLDEIGVSAERRAALKMDGII